ncbi:MAG: hypothetical protein ACJ70Y_07430, partial [Nitrososphaera sp.]
MPSSREERAAGGKKREGEKILLAASPDDISSKSKSNQVLARFLASIKSDATRRGAVAYLNAYMKYWKLYEEGSDNSSSLVYRYDWLLPNTSGQSGNVASVVVDIETIQDRIIQFVMDKKQQGLGAKAIDNYIVHLQKFYRVNGVKVGLIDWDLIHNYYPDN